MTSQTYNSVLSAVQGAMQDPPIDASRQPVVLQRDGEVMADSRDVAAYFGKEHRRVLQTIRELHCSDDFRRHNFVPFKIKDLSGESTSHILMTKDGFTFLAMGFTGEKAAKFKEAYIMRFNVMETELRSRPVIDPMAALNDPAALRNLLLGYSEQVLALKTENRELGVKADALNRIAEAEGSKCITDTAKALKMRPKDLFTWLHAHRWIYRRLGNKNWLAFEDKCKTGYLTHIVETVPLRDGGEKVVQHVHVTPKGLAKLAEMFTSKPSNEEAH
jgi:Rha family phage regulatory protein